MDCAHCGLPSPEGAPYCCTGCEAVAQAIAGLALGDYYRLRTRVANTPASLPHEQLARFDADAAQALFVRDAGAGCREAELLIEGMTCAACAWLVEGALARVPGVQSAVVGFATRKARVRWDGRARPSELLGAVAAVGCAAWPYEPGRVATVAGAERRALSRRLWIAALGMMQVMMYAFPAYVAGEGEMGAGIEALMRWAGLVLTLPVVAYSAGPFFAGAWRDLRIGRLGMDVPIAIGIAVAFAASAAATLRGAGDVYFDSITMFVFLLLGGRYLELLARVRAARELQHLQRLEPAVAERLRSGEGHATDVVAVSALTVGDRVLVRPGQGIPADGILEEPAATLNEAWLTGESRPVTRMPGERVAGGAINAGAAIVVRIERAGALSGLASITRMMERALEQRPRWVAAAERAAHGFVAAILGAALLALMVWWPSGPAHALAIAVAVLVVTCPCALALAAPTTFASACAALARDRLVVTRAQAVEGLAAATDIVFDKTGTLTEGRPRLLRVRRLGARGEPECRALALALARASSHPLDRAIAREAAEAAVAPALDHRAVAGEGVEARVDGRRVRLGRRDFARALHGCPSPDADRSGSSAWLADENGWIAVLEFGDDVRPEARAALERLHALGLRSHLLSGDANGEARRVAALLGIAQCEGEATPARKLEYVRALQARGARVAMVGDGINDAPVLASADVSIAMGGGADLAQVRADAVLLSDSLAGLARAMTRARRARRVLRQNLAWALGYNALAVPLAFAGMVTPLVAGAAMAASSLLVVANASRLLGDPWTSSTC